MSPPQGPARRPQRPPQPAYRPSSGGPLDLGTRCDPYVNRLLTGEDPVLTAGWEPPRSPDYRGRHGLRGPGD